jgi:hypothetical protein
VVLHVLVVDLQDVVVDVHHREGYRDVVRAEHLVLHRAHGPGGVLDQDLIDGDGDVAAGHEFARGQVRPQQLVREALPAHGRTSPARGTRAGTSAPSRSDSNPAAGIRPSS